MQQINIDELKPHPRNNEFFDDMTGEKWNEFLDSIKTRGVIEPIVITPEKVIVSGHQRVRACKELGIRSVMCDVHTYNNDDEILQDLLETNIRQRGNVGGSSKKVGMRLRELDRIYGIEHGGQYNNDDEILQDLLETNIRQRGNVGGSSKKVGMRLRELDRIYGIEHGGQRGNQYQEAKPNFSVLPQKTQEDLAKENNMSVDTYQNYKTLADMIPELDELEKTGIVTKSTALAIMKQLSEEEQEELISSMDTTKKITQKEVQKCIDKFKEEKNNPSYPSDYEQTQRELQNYKKDYEDLHRQFESKVEELQELRKQIEKMKETTPTEQYNQKLKDSTIFFCSKVAEFIEKVGGYVWLTEHLNELPEYERKSYISAINTVHIWSETMLDNINQ